MGPYYKVLQHNMSRKFYFLDSPFNFFRGNLGDIRWTLLKISPRILHIETQNDTETPIERYEISIM